MRHHMAIHRNKVLLAACSLAVFCILSVSMLDGRLAVFDSCVYNYISHYINNRFTSFMQIISFLGTSDATFIVAAALYGVLWKRREHRIYAHAMAVNTLMIWLLNIVFKWIFHRQRPDIHRLVAISGYSFPSGHSMASLSVYGLLGFILFVHAGSRRTKALIAFLFTLFILMIGLSRIYLGVHYASDVLAGYSLSLAWLCVYISLMERYISKP